jgi:hypothetical protein
MRRTVKSRLLFLCSFCSDEAAELADFLKVHGPVASIRVCRIHNIFGPVAGCEAPGCATKLLHMRAKFTTYAVCCLFVRDGCPA